jgi:hypothetical protein
MSEELKQFELFTSATSAGSAKVMSTHFGFISFFLPLFAQTLSQAWGPNLPNTAQRHE